LGNIWCLVYTNGLNKYTIHYKSLISQQRFWHKIKLTIFIILANKHVQNIYNFNVTHVHLTCCQQLMSIDYIITTQ
jgi:hypothetical protein